jgi:hypothetical protein
LKRLARQRLTARWTTRSVIHIANVPTLPAWCCRPKVETTASLVILRHNSNCAPIWTETVLITMATERPISVMKRDVDNSDVMDPGADGLEDGGGKRARRDDSDVGFDGAKLGDGTRVEALAVSSPHHLDDKVDAQGQDAHASLTQKKTADDADLDPKVVALLRRHCPPSAAVEQGSAEAWAAAVGRAIAERFGPDTSAVKRQLHTIISNCKRDGERLGRVPPSELAVMASEQVQNHHPLVAMKVVRHVCTLGV